MDSYGFHDRINKRTLTSRRECCEHAIHFDRRKGNGITEYGRITNDHSAAKELQNRFLEAKTIDFSYLSQQVWTISIYRENVHFPAKDTCHGVIGFLSNYQDRTLRTVHFWHHQRKGINVLFLVLIPRLISSFSFLPMGNCYVDARAKSRTFSFNKLWKLYCTDWAVLHLNSCFSGSILVTSDTDCSKRRSLRY